MSRLICALSLLNNVLRRGSRVWINSRYTLRFSLISFTILAGNGSAPGGGDSTGRCTIYINGGGWSGRPWGRQLLLEGEVDALTGVADSRFRPKYLSRREFD
jgi:hypothetical protein